MGVFDKLLRTGEGKKLKALAGIVPDVNALEPELERLDDDALRAKTAEFRQRLERGEDLDDLLIEAFAVTREGARRVSGQRHYDVQLMGGAALHFGWVAEMKTGEGKTLVSTLPAYLNGVAGTGVHIVTVNDYLASRDAEWMGRIHRFLGLSVGLVIPGEFDPAVKRAQYACDITYGTNNEYGFDYLRDNMAMSLGDKVQRGHSYAIVDEIDSILIDEARTPLIISGRLADAAAMYYKFAAVVRGLKRDVHYEVDEEKRSVAPTEEGVAAVEKALGVEHLYDEVSTNLVHQFQTALKAKELYRRDKDYLIADGEVKIVDEFTGRVLEGRRWGDGLHQAVEAKEGVRIKEENQTLATVTLQNYFRMYDKLSGMTGTAESEAAELYSTYGLQVVPIPTHRPMVRMDQPDLIFRSEDAKYDSLAEDLERRYEAGQPVLVGTTSVEKSERLAKILQRRGVPHEVLNAKQHHREAEIITQAGRLHSVTVATNMAGRGVDILLGGNPEGLASRAARGEGLEPGTVEYEQRLAELIPKFAEECAHEADVVRSLGGLYVLGTERHESRRIDNQLRGRSGRQGDPGESRFYLSLEDDLMRLFATGAMNWVMGRAMPEDEAIEAKMVTKAIERAQNTVEQRNAEVRKNVLKYDEVMNQQRMVIYEERRRILEGEDLKAQSHDMLVDVITAYVDGATAEGYSEDWDLEQLWGALRTLYPVGVDHHDLINSDTVGEAGDLTREELLSVLVADAEKAYAKREADVEAVAGPDAMRQLERNVLLNVLDRKWREHLYEMDYLKEGIGLRAMAQRDPLVEYQREGYDMFTGMLDALKEESVGFLFNVQIEAAPQAPAVAAQAMPEGLRARGIGEDTDRPLTYVGPSEDGDAEVQRHDAPVGAPSGGASRKQRREAARQENKERKLLRRR